MPTMLPVHEIILRLILDVIAAGLIGLNRDEHGRPAGFRTTLLVSLAACVAMIQANLLINSNGKPSDSFVVMDVMRLPLGILSGIGFIGAGAIIKREDLVVGVTTAATLWFVTVMGLCFGGGQILLGILSFASGILILSVLKKVELVIPREHQGQLVITLSRPGPDDTEIETLLRNSNLSVMSRSSRYEGIPNGEKTVCWSIRWTSKGQYTAPPLIIRELESRPGIHRLEFTAQP